MHPPADAYRPRTRHLRRLLLGLTAMAAIGASPGVRAQGDAPVEVKQKNRAFAPKEIEVQRGQTVRFINNDGDLVHHVHLKSDSFSFDSGEQMGGTSTDVRFTTPGHFTVLCGIHPRMRLAVDVK